MTTAPVMNTAYSNSSAENFRLWGRAISDSIAAVGFIKIDDANDVDWDTAVAPTDSNWVHIDYEIWRFNDALQSTFPLFFRLTYGRAAAGTGPGMTIIIGKGTSGAGVITNVLGTAPGIISSGCMGGNVATLTNGYVSSGDGSALCIIPFCGSESPAPMIIVDRSRDSTGAPTGDGVSVVANSGVDAAPSSGEDAYFSHGIYGMNYASKKWSVGVIPVIVPRFVDGSPLGDGGTLEVGLIGIVHPWTCHAPGLIPWQMLGGISWTDDPQGEFTARISGVAHHYLGIPLDRSHHGYGIAVARYDNGSNLPGFTSPQYTSSYIGLAIIWE